MALPLRGRKKSVAAPGKKVCPKISVAKTLLPDVGQKITIAAAKTVMGNLWQIMGRGQRQAVGHLLQLTELLARLLQGRLGMTSACEDLQ